MVVLVLDRMVDVHARSKLAEASRWLVSGLITNHQYDDLVLDDGGLPSSADPAIWEIYNTGFWLMYDDMHQYRFRGKHRLSRQARNAAARCILFLKSSVPYGWPVLSRPTGFGLTVLNLITLGFAGFAYSTWAKRGRDVAYWPFTSRAQYDEALRSPMYLHGTGHGDHSSRHDSSRDSMGNLTCRLRKGHAYARAGNGDTDG